MKIKKYLIYKQKNKKETREHGQPLKTTQNKTINDFFCKSVYALCVSFISIFIQYMTYVNLEIKVYRYTIYVLLYIGLISSENDVMKFIAKANVVLIKIMS